MTWRGINMIYLRKSKERGHANHGWLDSYHTFSFADYYDENFMGFRTLRVINEDRIAGGGGFPTHPHRDMEIITYMIEGELEHQDSMGNHEVIRPGEVQRMTAGTGVRHSEKNHSPNKEAHLLQIWIMTRQLGQEPGYGQKNFSKDLESKSLVLTTSMDGRDGSITINQDVDLYMGRLKAQEMFKYSINPGRHLWLQMIKGDVELGDLKIGPGDGIAVSGEKEISLSAKSSTEFLLFDLN